MSTASLGYPVRGTEGTNGERYTVGLAGEIDRYTSPIVTPVGSQNTCTTEITTCEPSIWNDSSMSWQVLQHAFASNNNYYTNLVLLNRRYFYSSAVLQANPSYLPYRLPSLYWAVNYNYYIVRKI